MMLFRGETIGYPRDSGGVVIREIFAYPDTSPDASYRKHGPWGGERDTNSVIFKVQLGLPMDIDCIFWWYLWECL
jgi:hypothetical protein